MSLNSLVADEWKKRQPHRVPVQEKYISTFRKQNLQLGKLENNVDILLKSSDDGMIRLS